MAGVSERPLLCGKPNGPEGPSQEGWLSVKSERKGRKRRLGILITFHKRGEWGNLYSLPKLERGIEAINRGWERGPEEKYLRLKERGTSRDDPLGETKKKTRGIILKNTSEYIRKRKAIQEGDKGGGI